MDHHVECLVVGTGPVGLVSALALAERGHHVALAGIQEPPARDGRTVAILDQGIEFLTALGLWDALRPLAAPLVEMRIIDDTASLFRPPPVTFKARELSLDAFGYNIELADLVAGLTGAIDRNPKIFRLPTTIDRFETGDKGIVAYHADEMVVSSKVLIGADGRHSVVRSFAEIDAKTWSYPQTAITALFSHEIDHEDRSTEFHTRGGPFTLVPLTGHRSSLVWMMPPAEAERMMSFSDHDFSRAVEKRAHSLLGKMSVEGRRGQIPMTGLSTSLYARDHVALLGEAAHVFPPIGAQGLNLGLRDISSFMRATKSGLTPAAFSEFNRDRQKDVKFRTVAVDMVNRSLLADFMHVDFLRGAGLLALATFKPLRQFVMKRGAGF